MSEQSHTLNKGLHIVVATPGRLIDMLEKKRFTFNNCKYLCMDEADRMVDLGFEDDVRNIMSFFKVCVTLTYFTHNARSLGALETATDVALLRYYATENPRFCAAVTCKAGAG